MAETATKTAVHVPCSLMAFRAILLTRGSIRSTPGKGPTYELEKSVSTQNAFNGQWRRTESKPLPTTQVMYSQYATAMNSLPTFPPSMYPTSATLYTSGCRSLNLPTIQPGKRQRASPDRGMRDIPAHVVITPRVIKMMIPGSYQHMRRSAPQPGDIPGMIPNVPNTLGTLSTPSPICVLKSNTAVATRPSAAGRLKTSRPVTTHTSSPRRDN